MKKIILVLFLMLGELVWAGLDDYQLRRLPISTGQQFIDANGNLRVILPSHISNDGIMGGIRLTWERPEEGGGVVRLVNQSGYLYDLNSRTFIAQQISQQAITYVGSDHYLSKRLHPNSRRWQTYRCPLNGLVQRPDSTVYDNPSCVLIDNDFLDQEPPQGTAESFWASQFISFTMLAASGFGYVASNQNGSSAVYDLYDDHSQPGPDRYNLYTVNGHKIPVDAAFYAAAGIDYDPIADNSASFTMFGAQGASDVGWLAFNGEPSIVHKIVLLPDGSPQSTSIVINQQKPDMTYSEVLAISKDGLILTSTGTCTFDSGCTDGLVFDEPVEMGGTSMIFLNNGLWVAGNLMGTSDFMIADFRSNEPHGVYPEQVIEDRFSEQLGSGPAFVFPASVSFNSALRLSPSVSEDGNHIVIAGRLTDGRYRVYHFQKQ